ncbi:GyrI-like domain-containing protein [Leifsonia sp. NPDC058194]|uniref:GyrI-like domain-containing protein n=1 Tax=Leifsonia sp. NPDC058194 TaxID=3346374 RepID=UPI0036DA2843
MTSSPLPAFVAGHAIRTNNAAEATDGGLIPGVWQRTGADAGLLALPGRRGDELYAVLCDYESDQDGAYTQVVGVGIDDPREVPVGLVVVAVDGEARVAFEAAGEMPSALIGAWGSVWQQSADGTLRRTFTVDVEVHRPDGTATVFVAGTRVPTA